MNYTTKITTLFDEDAQELMTDKMYPLYSHKSKPIIAEIQANKLTKIFVEQKLNRFYACIEKAKIVANYFSIDVIHLGSLMVESTEDGVSYGYLYNPPLELHAWVEIVDNIIDFALAGTIEKGLMTKDNIGPFLINREPIILAGIAPPWLHYKTHQVITVDNVNVLEDVEHIKNLLSTQYGNNK